MVETGPTPTTLRRDLRFIVLVCLGIVTLVGLLGPWAHGTLVEESASGMTEPTATDTTVYGTTAGALLLLVPLAAAGVALVSPLGDRLRHGACAVFFAVVTAGTVYAAAHQGLGLFWFHRFELFTTWEDVRLGWGLIVALGASAAGALTAAQAAFVPHSESSSRSASVD